MIASTKTNHYDNEVLGIRNNLLWAGVQSSDRVEVVFWQDSYGPLVSFARRTKRHTVMLFLEVQYGELREVGFSYDFIAKITSTLREWAKKLLNPDEKGVERKQVPVPSVDDMALNFLSMFYTDDGGDAEGGIGNGE